MTKSIKKNSIFLVGSYGRGNLGDDVFLVCATNLFGEKMFYINSYNDQSLPNDIKNIQTVSTSSMRDLRSKVAIFFRVKHIIYWGGDVWVELHGNIFPRQSLYKMTLLNILASVSGKKIYYMGNGAGELTGFSLWLARVNVRLADKVIIREKRSAELLDSKKTTWFADIAINLGMYNPYIHTLPSADKKFIIGISFLYHIPDASENFHFTIRKIAKSLSLLNENEYKIVLMPLYISKDTNRDDVWALNELKKLISDKFEVEMFVAKSVKDFVDKTSQLHLMIGARLHANILSCFNATPSIGIAYRPKVRSFFEDNNIENFCIDLNAVDQLSNKIQYIKNNYEYVSKIFYSVSQNNLSMKSLYEEFVNSNL